MLEGYEKDKKFSYECSPISCQNQSLCSGSVNFIAFQNLNIPTSTFFSILCSFSSLVIDPQLTSFPGINFSISKIFLNFNLSLLHPPNLSTFSSRSHSAVSFAIYQSLFSYFTVCFYVQ